MLMAVADVATFADILMPELMPSRCHFALMLRLPDSAPAAIMLYRSAIAASATYALAIFEQRVFRYVYSSPSTVTVPYVSYDIHAATPRH